MEFKIRSSIITTLVLISTTFILSEPVGHGFQPFQRRSGSQGRESGPQHYVMPIMRTSHTTDKHQHILKENYVQKPFQQQERQSPEPKDNPETTKKPEETTRNPVVISPPTQTPQGRALTEKSNKSRVVQVVKTYQTLKTTTTTRKPKLETTTVHLRHSLSAPTTTISPMKMTTKEIPEIREGSQDEDEVKGNSAAANTIGESGTQPIAGAQTRGTVSKLKDTNVQDKKEAKLKKKHHHRHHHSGHRHNNHHKHQGKNHPEGRHSSDNHSHKRHHSHHGLNHPHRFHGIKSRGGSHHRHHRHHHDSSHAQVVAGTSTLHGSRVKREEPMKMNETKEPDMNNKKSEETGASGESKSLEGNEMDDHGESTSISSESNEAGRSNMDPLDVLDVAPGPYLQQNSEEDDSEEMGRVEVAVGEPELKNWNEYVANQRSSLLANPNKKTLYKHRGYVPIMQPEDHFKQIDQQYKEKNDRMIAFHNLFNFIRQRKMKFKIPDEPPARARAGTRIFVDLMSDME